MAEDIFDNGDGRLIPGPWRDRAGTPVKVGDTIHMAGVPFDVIVLELVACDEGCTHGAARIKDPVSGDPDEVCLSEFVTRGQVGAGGN